VEVIVTIEEHRKVSQKINIHYQEVRKSLREINDFIQDRVFSDSPGGWDPQVANELEELNKKLKKVL